MLRVTPCGSNSWTNSLFKMHFKQRGCFPRCLQEKQFLSPPWVPRLRSYSNSQPLHIGLASSGIAPALFMSCISSGLAVCHFSLNLVKSARVRKTRTEQTFINNTEPPASMTLSSTSIRDGFKCLLQRKQPVTCPLIQPPLSLSSFLQPRTNAN